MAVHVCVCVCLCVSVSVGVCVCVCAVTHPGLRGTLAKSDFDNPSGKEIS